MTHTVIDSQVFRDMAVAGATMLENNREPINALNVFPVPDGDTGTNMSLTMQAAAREITACEASAVGELADALAKGALRGARGNSGVILSQIFRGFARALSGLHSVDAKAFAYALKSGSDMAYKAIMKPREGTILTVIRVIAEEALKYTSASDDLFGMFSVVLTSGEIILKKTTEMLPALRQANVVDAGGRGLLDILYGFSAALNGQVIEAALQREDVDHSAFIDDHDAIGEIVFTYCTEFLISPMREGIREIEIEALRTRLSNIGDCVLVVGDVELVKVHIHTNDPGKAMQYALRLGELDNLKIENMKAQRREITAKKAAEQKEEERIAEKKRYGFVTVSLGPGMSEIFKDLGVDGVVEGGQTMNPSIDDMCSAIQAVNAETIFVLPNNSNVILAAQQAADILPGDIRVLPTKSMPMGISAMISYMPEADADENFAEMQEAAERVHTGSITFAVRDSSFDDQAIHEGDIIGLIDNKISAVGEDIQSVSLKIIEGMINDSSEMITIYSGNDVNQTDAEHLYNLIEEKYIMCDVQLINGGQPLYYYLISVE